MKTWWRERVFSQEEAADLAGLHLSTLKDWASTVATRFVSEKRGSRRWYSAEDILILRVADELVKGGFVTLLAVAVAWEHVTDASFYPADALLVAKPGSTTTTAVRLCFRVEDAPNWDSLQIIKLGQIAEATIAACEAAYA